MQKLLEELRGIPQEDRSARFVSVIAAVFPDGGSFTVRGECEGRILEEKRGESGFGYDPVFFYPQFNATFSQISAEEKNKISHRAKSMELFGEKISRILNK
ncbi:MAG: non-canonical purine NTP pyrophosphatase [Eubacteriales bacterium]